MILQVTGLGAARARVVRGVIGTFLPPRLDRLQGRLRGEGPGLYRERLADLQERTDAHATKQRDPGAEPVDRSKKSLSLVKVLPDGLNEKIVPKPNCPPEPIVP